MRARIYQRPKTATQSGTAGAGNWVLDWQSPHREVNEPLMGWWGSGNTQGQVRLRFDTLEEAIAFADKKKLDYSIIEPQARTPKPKAYADNFRYDRVRS